MVEPMNPFVQFAMHAHLLGMKRFDFDVAIIGGGSGGYAAARTTADAD